MCTSKYNNFEPDTFPHGGDDALKQFSAKIFIPALAALLSLPIIAQTPSLQSFDPTSQAACDAHLPPANDEPRNARIADCANLDGDLIETDFAILRQRVGTENNARQAAFVKLIAAFERYGNRRLEVVDVLCGDGNGCTVDAQIDAALINYKFLVLTELARTSQLPSLPAVTPLQEATQLATARSRILAAPTDAKPRFPAVLDNFEQSWQTYRDAWLYYARLTYPNVPAATWRAYLLKEHLDQLERL